MLKGKDKRDQKERGGKSRGRRPGLRLCHSGGIWPDDGFTAFKCVRYTSINSSRLHRSHTCNSQHANYREEADSDSCWKLPNFQKGGGEPGISVLRQPRQSLDPCWEKGQDCSQGRLAGKPPRGWGPKGEVEAPGCGVPFWGWVCPSISPSVQAGQLFPSVLIPTTGDRDVAISHQRCPLEDITEVCSR